MPSTSNIAASGKPPAKLMMPGLPRSLNSSRMAEVSTLSRRLAKGSWLMAHILRHELEDTGLRVGARNDKLLVLRGDFAAPGAGLLPARFEQLLELHQVAL